MDRTIINPLEQMRDFDFVMFEHDVLVGLGNLIRDVLSNAVSNSVGAGFAVTATTPATLTVNIGPGRVYSLAHPDPTSVGSIPQDILLTTMMQGQNPGQTLTFIPPASGQSQWNLVQVQFSPVDQVRDGDPNGGVVPFYNSTNPTIPNNASIATVRQHRAVIQVIQGTAGTTGSEVPPQPSAGWSPLYLVDIAGGQSSITAGQLVPAGPSVGINVPSNYPYAPFLAGFQASHHSGNPGQAPKINLQTEVQGVLPAANLPPNVLTGTFPTVRQVLTGALTLYVSTTGGDANNGLTAGTPFQTIQAAIAKIYSTYDLAGYPVTINVGAGTFASVQFAGPPVGANPTGVPITLNGAGASTIISASNGSSIKATGAVIVQVQNCYLTATGVVTNGTGNGIAAANGAQVYVGIGVTFGACGGASMLANGGFIVCNTSYTLSGGGGAHLWAGIGGYISSTVAVTIANTPAFSASFAYATQNGSMNCSGMTFNGGATGQRYTAIYNGVINTSSGGAKFFPGTTPGATSLGGIYN